LPNRLCRLFVALLLQVLALSAAPALATSSHLRPELVVAGPVASGGKVELALHFRPEPGWHGYWLNPGDAGLGMSLAWNLPEGARVGPPRYPVPHVLLISGLMNHVYEQDYAVLQELTVPDGLRPGAELPILLKADWLACTDKICVPESAELQATVKIASGAAEPADPRFDEWQRRMPAPLGGSAQFAISGGRIRVAIPLPASQSLEQPHLFIATDHVVDYAAPQEFRRKGDLLLVTLNRAKFQAIKPSTLIGVLRLNPSGDGIVLSAWPGLVPSGGDPVADGDAGLHLPALPLLLLAAIAGGLLLNIMPCVFPILSLKALSLARAGESETEARSEGLAYTAGVVLACLALGGLLLALRAGGTRVGWAFQLQEPAVVAGLFLLAVALTANFLGVFEFAVPGFAREGSSRNAFATGLLAAFVATPCTGPFMAAAMGAALLLPTLPALALFAALGLGIALPFLAIAMVPALRRLLPRPGPWMMRFRRWMALPMGLTALALVWLESRLGGTTFALLSLGFAVGITGALLAVGGRQRRGNSALAPAASAVLLAVAAVMALPQTVHRSEVAEQGVLPARPFTAAALAEARATGKPVFVWFTADWCLTCKVNEQVAIERDDVRQAFAKAGVIALRGDWTRRDPAITRFLTTQGAAGVPLYLWYPAGGSEPRQLAQVLTPSSLIDLTK